MPFARAGRERWENALLSAALLLPIVLAIVILVHARRAERSQRDLAERALAHYSAVAAWQLASRIDGEFHARIEMLVRPLTSGPTAMHERRAAPGGAPMDCDCADSAATLMMFRYIPTAGRLDIVAGSADGPTRAAVERAARDAAADGTNEPHRVVFRRIADSPRAVAMSVPGDAGAHGGGVVQGVVTDADGFRRVITSILEHHAVLPPQLLPPPYTGRELAVRVRDGAGFVLFENDGSFSPSGAARDSVPRYHDLRVDVEIAPAVAQALIIGGLPPTRVPALLGLLAVATLLAAVAFVQHRRARELDRMRTQFIASVSHELRTPLTQISMFGETLKLGRERSEMERRQFASIIHREATRLSGLVDNVLRYTRGGTDRFTLRPEVRRVADEIDQAVAAFRPIAESMPAQISLDLDRDILARVDPGAARQVILNLLDNAVKYGPAGQRIDVSLAREDGWAVLRVADEGQGIPQADLERIFQPFTRLEGTGRNVAGTGIGLAVVRELVTALGGTVTAEAREGGGSVFTVRLPAVDVRPAP